MYCLCTCVESSWLGYAVDSIAEMAIYFENSRSEKSHETKSNSVVYPLTPPARIPKHIATPCIHTSAYSCCHINMNTALSLVPHSHAHSFSLPPDIHTHSHKLRDDTSIVYSGNEKSKTYSAIDLSHSFTF